MMLVVVMMMLRSLYLPTYLLASALLPLSIIRVQVAVRQELTYIPTYLPTYPPTHLHTHLPTYLLAGVLLSLTIRVQASVR